MARKFRHQDNQAYFLLSKNIVFNSSHHLKVLITGDSSTVWLSSPVSSHHCLFFTLLFDLWKYFSSLRCPGQNISHRKTDSNAINKRWIKLIKTIQYTNIHLCKCFKYNLTTDDCRPVRYEALCRVLIKIYVLTCLLPYFGFPHTNFVKISEWVQILLFPQGSRLAKPPTRGISCLSLCLYVIRKASQHRKDLL